MSDDGTVRPASAAVHAEPQGGDAACWLSELCPGCGALTEDPTAACWRCGLSPSDRLPEL